MTSFLLLGGIAAGNGISIDRLDLPDDGPLSFLTRFFAESSSPVMLLNHCMRQEGPLSSDPGKQAPARSKTGPRDTVGCLPEATTLRTCLVRTALLPPLNARFAPVSPCFAGSPVDSGGPPGQPVSSGCATVIPLFMLAFFILLSRSDLPAAPMLFDRANSTRPGPARSGFLFAGDGVA